MHHVCVLGEKYCKITESIVSGKLRDVDPHFSKPETAIFLVVEKHDTTLHKEREILSCSLLVFHKRRLTICFPHHPFLSSKRMAFVIVFGKMIKMSRL